MDLPHYFPDHDRSEKLIGDLLERVKTLDGPAKNRLSTMLDEEADLPMLDKLERSYRERVQTTLAKLTDKESAVELANALRSHFNRNLVLQREFLHDQVRKVLQGAEAGEQSNAE